MQGEAREQEREQGHEGYQVEMGMGQQGFQWMAYRGSQWMVAGNLAKDLVC